MMPANRIVGEDARRKVLNGGIRYDESASVRLRHSSHSTRDGATGRICALCSLEPSPQLSGSTGSPAIVLHHPDQPPTKIQKACLSSFHHAALRLSTAFPAMRARFPFRLKLRPARRAVRGAFSELTLPGMEAESDKITANLSPAARAYLASLGLPDPDTDQATAEADLVPRAGHRLFARLSRRERGRHPAGLAADSASEGEGCAARLRGPWAAGGSLTGHGSAGSRRYCRKDSGRPEEHRGLSARGRKTGETRGRRP